jgi:hypothetical protein
VSDTLIAAMFSVVAIAILAPIANHLITKYRERSSIHATLRVHEAPLPALLKKYFHDLRYPSLAQASFSSPFNNTQLDAFHFLKGYMKLTLHNPSKKKLNAVTVILTEHLREALYQIEDEPELHGPIEKKINLGDLQPGKSRTVHIWTSFAFVDWHRTRLPILFEVSADEFDKLTLKFPFPGYLKSLLLWRLSWYVALVSIIITVAIWLPDLVRWFSRVRT